MNELIETWVIHNRINLFLLDAIDEKYLADISASTYGSSFVALSS